MPAQGDKVTYEIAVEKLADQFHDIQRLEVNKQSRLADITEHHEIPDTYIRELDKAVARFVIGYCSDNSLMRMMNAHIE